jgi:hypothetical protein
MAKFSNIVKYSGLDNLNLIEKIKLKNIAESRYNKIYRSLRGIPMDLSINVKVYEKEKRKKYSIHGKIEAPTKIFSAKAFGWDIKKTTHEVLIKLENEIKKKFKYQKKSWKFGFKNFLVEKFMK